MSAKESKSAVKDPVTRPLSTAGQATEMESEGQGQSTSVPPDPDHTGGRKRGTKRADSAGNVEEGAEADQDIDTAGAEMDEER